MLKPLSCCIGGNTKKTLTQRRKIKITNKEKRINLHIDAKHADAEDETFNAEQVDCYFILPKQLHFKHANSDDMMMGAHLMVFFFFLNNTEQ